MEDLRDLKDLTVHDVHCIGENKSQRRRVCVRWLRDALDFNEWMNGRRVSVLWLSRRVSQCRRVCVRWHWGRNVRGGRLEGLA